MGIFVGLCILFMGFSYYGVAEINSRPTTRRLKPRILAPTDVREELRLKKRARIEAHYKKISTPRWD